MSTAANAEAIYTLFLLWLDVDTPPFSSQRISHLIFLIQASKLIMKGWMAKGLVDFRSHTPLIACAEDSGM